MTILVKETWTSILNLKSLEKTLNKDKYTNSNYLYIPRSSQPTIQ